MRIRKRITSSFFIFETVELSSHIPGTMITTIVNFTARETLNREYSHIATAMVFNILKAFKFTFFCLILRVSEDVILPILFTVLPNTFHDPSFRFASVVACALAVGTFRMV